MGTIFAAMSITVIWMFWDLRRKAWFWFVMGLITTLHIFLVLHFSWSDRNYPGVVLLPEALVDLAVMYYLFLLIERAVSI